MTFRRLNVPELLKEEFEGKKLGDGIAVNNARRRLSAWSRLHTYLSRRDEIKIPEMINFLRQTSQICKGKFA